MDATTRAALDDEIKIQKHFDIVGFQTLYRARYDEHFDNTDPTQYGYIQNAELIKPFRFNKSKEQVMYTSTNPGVAYKETMKENQDTFFYMSLWELKGCLCDFNSYRIYADNYRGVSTKSYFEVIKKNYENDVLKINNAIVIRTALEQNPVGVNQDYALSSEIASEIFQNFGAIISVSQKSYGQEVNVNFNKQTADKFQINCIYHCRSLSQSEIDMFEQNQTTLPVMYRVDMIGLLKGGKIEWYKYEIDIDTISEYGNPNELFPNKQWFVDRIIGIEDVYMDVVNCHDSFHNFTFNKDNKEYWFNAKIKLHPMVK